MTDKITIERETLERAIEAFAMHANAYPHMLKGYMVDAADELRAALAQKAEPQSMQPLPNHDNHHNALKCPYCNPRRLKFADPEAAPPAPAAVPLNACGAPAVGGPCVLPAGHNMGRADVPMNHQAAVPP